MANNSDVNKLLADAAEKIRQEAYAAGWRDAISAINKAVSEVGEPSGSATIEIGAGEFSVTGGNAKMGRSPTQGTTPWYVVQAINRKPGMTGAEIVNAVQEGGHNVSEGSIRTSIARMKKRKFIVDRHGKWFPM